MAKTEKSEATARDRVSRLIDAAKGDTLYWDLYIRRAAAQLAPVFSRDLHELLKRGDAAVAEATRAGSLALNRNDWDKVKEAAAQVRDLQRARTERKADMRLGEAVYDLTEIPIDPFSPGFGPLFHGAPEALRKERDRLVAALRDLEGIDPEWREFYADRRARFEKLEISGQEVKAAQAATDPNALRRQAMMLLESGDVDQVSRIADLIMATEKAAPERVAAGASGRPAPAAPTARPPRTRDTAPKIPEAAVSKAAGLGLVSDFRDANLEAVGYIHRNAWHPTFPGEQKTSNGGLRVQDDPESLAVFRDAPADAREFIRDVLSKFALHPYVSSAGTRYLPPLDSEWLLVEDFPEDAVPDTSPLIQALGLPHRRGLSRAAIERALLDRGADVIEGTLGLDPREFRLVCIPVDAYTNLGQRRGWGAQPFWTHFDGYQVLPKGGQRALAGGDARFGGLLDLCSISRMDEREGMVLRLAVLRRERMILE